MNEKIKKMLMGILIAIILAFYEAFAVMTIYNLTISCIFNIGQLNYWSAFGICIFVNALSISRNNAKEKLDPEESLIIHYIAIFITYAILMGIAALVNLGI